MLGDLDEEFAARVQQPEGLRGARAWYWRQVRTVVTQPRAPKRVEPDLSRFRRATMLDTLRQDVAYALRGLRKQPGFTAVVVLTLALGIGANTAIFSLLDAVVLRSMPVERPEELVLLMVPHGDGFDPSFNYPLFEDYRDKNEVFTGLVGYDAAAMHVTLGQESERIIGMQVSWNFFDVLGVRPVVGRGFVEDEGRLGAPAQVAVISYGLWEDRFEGKADAVGREILINGQRFTIIGVAPPRFTGVMRGQGSEIYVPITTPLDSLANPGQWQERLRNRGFPWMQILGRLKPAITHQQAQTAMRTLAEQRLRSLSTPRMAATLLSLLGALGLLLGTLGALWRDGVRGVATHSRDRHPHGAGRSARRHSAACAAAGLDAGLHRAGSRTGRRNCGPTADGGPAPSDAAGRPADDWHGRRAIGGSRAGGVLPAGASRGARGSPGGTALRMSFRACEQARGRGRTLCFPPRGSRRTNSQRQTSGVDESVLSREPGTSWERVLGIPASESIHSAREAGAPLSRTEHPEE